MGYLAGLAGEGGAGAGAGAGGMAAAGDAGMGVGSAGAGGLGGGLSGMAGSGMAGAGDAGMGVGSTGMGSGLNSAPLDSSLLSQFGQDVGRNEFGAAKPTGMPGPASPSRAGMFQMEKGKSPADIAANMLSGAIKGKATTPMTLPSMPQRRGGAGSAPPPGLGSYTQSLQSYRPQGSGGGPGSLSDLLSQLARGR